MSNKPTPEQVADFEGDELNKLPTGILHLDRNPSLQGGLKPGEIAVFAAKSTVYHGGVLPSTMARRVAASEVELSYNKDAVIEEIHGDTNGKVTVIK